MWACHSWVADGRWIVTCMYLYFWVGRQDFLVLQHQVIGCDWCLANFCRRLAHQTAWERNFQKVVLVHERIYHRLFFVNSGWQPGKTVALEFWTLEVDCCQISCIRKPLSSSCHKNLWVKLLLVTTFESWMSFVSLLGCPHQHFRSVSNLKITSAQLPTFISGLKLENHAENPSWSAISRVSRLSQLNSPDLRRRCGWTVRVLHL